MNQNTKPSVSIIIPVYNVEDYVEKCLKSVINQTLKEIEIIVIDDGSTDSSPVILDRIAETDSRIKAVHTTNCGVSAARNKGLEIAEGRYIGFVDSDDYIEPDMYEKMLSVAEKNKCDVVQCAFYSGDIDKNDIERESAGVYDSHQALKNSVKIAAGTIWNKVYSAKILCGLRFDETWSFCEDRLFNIDVFSKCNMLVVIEDVLYHYVYRKDSAARSKPSQKNIDGLRFYDYIVEKAGGDIEIINTAIQQKASDLIFLLIVMCLVNPNSTKLSCRIPQHYRDRRKVGEDSYMHSA